MPTDRRLPQPPTPEDAAGRALNETLAGDHAALDELLCLCWDSVANYAAGLTGSVESGEDVAQETFFRIWSRRAIWYARGEASVGLLFRIARNLALNERRADARRERSLSLYQHGAGRNPASASQDAEESEIRSAVEAGIEALPDRRREVFVLARLHGLSYKEIADVMGISRQTVANQMSAALESLRQDLKHFIVPTASRTETRTRTDQGVIRRPPRRVAPPFTT